MLATPMRPVIGICGAVESARWGVWDAPAVLTPLDYVRAVQAAGGPGRDRAAGPGSTALVPEQLLDELDGLILAGGADVDPSFYGAAPHPATIGTSPARDEAEIALTRAAIERDMPVLGICRGMQLLNVARGGTLIQHLPESVGHDGHRPTPGSFDGLRARRAADRRVARGALGRRVAAPHQAASPPGRRRTRRGPRRDRLVGARRAARRRSSCPAGASCSVCSGTPRSIRTRR